MQSKKEIWEARITSSIAYLRTNGAEGVGEEIKELVPARSRWWNMFHKEWEIAVGYWPAVEKMLTDEYGAGPVYEMTLRRDVVRRR